MRFNSLFLLSDKKIIVYQHSKSIKDIIYKTSEVKSPFDIDNNFIIKIKK